MAIDRRGDRTPLFCLHGEPLRIAMRLERRRPIFALNYAYAVTRPRDIPPSVEGVAARYIDAMRTEQPSGPYQLFGFSAGATIGYEMARQLRETGDTVALLFMSEPTLHSASSPQRLARIATDFLGPRKGEGHLQAAVSTVKGIVARRPEAVRRRAIEAWCAVTGRPLPERLRWVRYLERIRPSVRRYVYRDIGMPVYILYGGLDEVGLGYYTDFWSAIIGTDLTLYNVPGVRRHLDLMSDPGLGSLVARLEGALID